MTALDARHALAVAFFLLAPFTWSFIVALGGFLLRPTDLIFLALIGLTFAGKRVILPPLLPLGLLFAIVVMTLGRGIVHSDAGSIVSAVKICFYMLGVICLSDTLVSIRGMDRARKVVWTKVVLVIYLSFFTVIAIAAVRSALSLSSAQQIGGTIFRMWNAVFHFNFFGPSGVREVIGVSFRNTAGIGFLTASLFFYFLSGRMSALPTTLFIVALLTFSRSVWLAQVVFLMSLAGIRGGRRGLGVMFLVALGGMALLSSPLAVDLVLDRLSSSGGRVDILGTVLDTLNQNILFGSAEGAKVLNSYGDEKTVHNVPLALALELGALGGGLMFLVVIYFLVQGGLVALGPLLPGANKGSDPVLSSVLLVTAVILVLRPMISASYTNIYSVGEWGAFALFFAALRLRRADAAQRVADQQARMQAQKQAGTAAQVASRMPPVAAAPIAMR